MDLQNGQNMMAQYPTIREYVQYRVHYSGAILPMLSYCGTLGHYVLGIACLIEFHDIYGDSMVAELPGSGLLQLVTSEPWPCDFKAVASRSSNEEQKLALMLWKRSPFWRRAQKAMAKVCIPWVSLPYLPVRATPKDCCKHCPLVIHTTLTKTTPPKSRFLQYQLKGSNTTL